MPRESNRDEQVIEQTRMSFGDHLEELRSRLIRALAGLVVATIVCFHFGDHIIEILTTPYCVAMEQLGFDPRMVQLNPIESFIEYFKISLKFGLVLAAPWMLYQIWRFIATGLYASERRVVQHFAPASIILFIVGATFMVCVVLSGLMKFLIGISLWFPLPQHDNLLYRWLQEPAAVVAASQPAAPPVCVPVLDANPETPTPGEIWFNRSNRQLSVFDGEQRHYLQLNAAADRQFVQPFFSVSEYLGFVVNLALSFGLGFQIPIVVIFLIALRLVPSKTMSKARRYIILAVIVLAAILTPTPDVGTMLLLAVPMLLLFESGLFIGRIVERRDAAAAEEDGKAA